MWLVQTVTAELTFVVAAHALASNRFHLFYGSSEECISDLKASACLEEAVPIEWFHHGSIKDPDLLIHRLKHIKVAVGWGYGKRKRNRCMMMDALRLSAHPGPCRSCLSAHVSLRRAVQ